MRIKQAMVQRLAIATVAAGIFGGGMLAGRMSGSSAVDATGLYVDWCYYRVRTEYDGSYSYKSLTAIAGKNGRSDYMSDRDMRQAVGEFDCERG